MEVISVNSIAFFKRSPNLDIDDFHDTLDDLLVVIGFGEVIRLINIDPRV
jgi:hypothetical protein